MYMYGYVRMCRCPSRPEASDLSGICEPLGTELRSYATAKPTHSLWLSPQPLHLVTYQSPFSSQHLAGAETEVQC